MSISEQVNWQKMKGLVPAIIQDSQTGKVLMLGYMNEAALNRTLSSKQVTFYSRSRKTLWVKGETSGNYLELVDISVDCDNDSLLVLANPIGPTCHKGESSCFQTGYQSQQTILDELQTVIAMRDKQRPENSYTSKLLSQGISHIAQKVGEEGLEVALSAVDPTQNNLCEEVADLLYHLLVLLQAKRIPLNDVFGVLQKRVGSSHIVIQNNEDAV